MSYAAYPGLTPGSRDCQIHTSLNPLRRCFKSWWICFFYVFFFLKFLDFGVVGNLRRFLKAWCNFATCKDDPRCHSKYTQHFDVRKHLKLDFGRLGILGKASTGADTSKCLALSIGIICQHSVDEHLAFQVFLPYNTTVMSIQIMYSRQWFPEKKITIFSRAIWSNEN